MDEFEITIEKEIKLTKPLLVEGLPGLGLVGKIAAEHLVDELHADKIATMRSTIFPPQVMITEDGTVDLMENQFYAWKAEKKDQHDLLFIVGDHQGTSSTSHYKLSEKILDIAEMYKTTQIYTLGGYGTGNMSRKPKVFGAVTDKKMIKPLKQIGVSFEKTGGIVGAAGLMIGLGKLRGMPGACFMGETHGQIIDPRSAKSVLEILTKLLKVDINLNELDKKAKETEKAIERARKLEQQRVQMESFPPEQEGQNYFR
ncbi:proteasome assembly chaperone family protein [archaeon]|nr:proteasome assembly chaperone family protein [archaeon]